MITVMLYGVYNLVMFPEKTLWKHFYKLQCSGFSKVYSVVVFRPREVSSPVTPPPPTPPPVNPPPPYHHPQKFVQKIVEATLPDYPAN